MPKIKDSQKQRKKHKTTIRRFSFFFHIKVVQNNNNNDINTTVHISRRCFFPLCIFTITSNRELTNMKFVTIFSIVGFEYRGKFIYFSVCILLTGIIVPVHGIYTHTHIQWYEIFVHSSFAKISCCYIQQKSTST